MTVLTEEEAKVMAEEQRLLNETMDLVREAVDFGKEFERKRIIKVIEGFEEHHKKGCEARWCCLNSENWKELIKKTKGE